MPIGNDTLCSHMSLCHDRFIQNISKLTQFTTKACIKTLSRKLVFTYIAFSFAQIFYGYFQLPRSISHSLQPIYFLYDWVLSYVPTVWRGPASQSHLLHLKLNFQPLLGFATKLFPRVWNIESMGTRLDTTGFIGWWGPQGPKVNSTQIIIFFFLPIALRLCTTTPSSKQVVGAAWGGYNMVQLLSLWKSNGHVTS